VDAAAGSMSDIAHAIQLALAPVFLLTGIAGILNVMAQRLSRIIDRGRRIEEAVDVPLNDTLRAEMGVLEKRRMLASWAIYACTGAALLVCVVIAVLFAGTLMGFDVRLLAGILFTAATVLLVIGLTLFLREIHMGTRWVRRAK
jgi:hypothetical protein